MGAPDFPSPNAVEVSRINFSYDPMGLEPVIKSLSLSLRRGSRCLLLGANGAGKTTLLRVLAGKHLVGGRESVRVLGRSAFHDLSLSCEGHVAHLDAAGSWTRRVGGAGEISLQGDFSAEHMIFGVADADPIRRSLLLDILDIDLGWRMHKVSDGQRRRVQICMALLRPFQLLLLDEVTVDLDVVARMDLLEFLRRETEERGATVIHSTHILDGLENWPSHIALMDSGEVKRRGWVRILQTPNFKIENGTLVSVVDAIEGDDKDKESESASSQGRLTRENSKEEREGAGEKLGQKDEDWSEEVVLLSSAISSFPYSLSSLRTPSASSLLSLAEGWLRIEKYNREREHERDRQEKKSSENGTAQVSSSSPSDAAGASNAVISSAAIAVVGTPLVDPFLSSPFGVGASVRRHMAYK